MFLKKWWIYFSWEYSRSFTMGPILHPCLFILLPPHGNRILGTFGFSTFPKYSILIFMSLPTFNVHSHFPSCPSSPSLLCQTNVSLNKANTSISRGTVSGPFFPTYLTELIAFISTFLWHLVFSCLWGDAARQWVKYQTSWFGIMTLSLMSCATLNKLLKISKSQFPYL